MQTEHAELWGRIRAFSLDEPGSDLTFTQRLARENGWSGSYARRVVEEYQKFVLLAVAAGHPVSPSDQVDQAWHVHMTCTRSYWERFCREILRKPLHHEPTRGGRDEARKFAAMYEKTLGSYRAFFGQEPPADIWPETRVRFGEDTHFERVNVNRSVILSKGTIRGTVAVLGASAGVLCLLLFGESLASSFRSAMNLRGPDFLGFYLLVFGAVLAGGLLFRRTQRQPSDEPTPSEADLDPYEVAYLAGGEKQAANAAIASLVERKVLGSNPAAHRIRRDGTLGKDAPLLERALLGAAREETGSEISALHAAAKPVLENIRSRLTTMGLLVSESRELGTRAVTILLVLATCLFGLAKVSVGHDRHRPVGLLVFLVLASGVAGIVALGRKLGRSRRGDRALERLRHEYHDLEAKAARAQAGLTTLEVPMAAALSGGPFDSLKATLKPPSISSSGCGRGCGGGCGGGGCGGGCGGCGGCG